jgi:capsular exopolysaccharide synthesis family protein
VLKEVERAPDFLDLFQELQKVNAYIHEINKVLIGDAKAKALSSARAEKADTEKKLKRAASELWPAAEKQVRKRIEEDLKQQEARLRLDVEGLQLQHDNQVRHLEKVHAATRKVGSGGLPPEASIVKLQNEVTALKEALTSVQKQLGKLRAEPVADGRSQVLQRAQTPDERDHSRQIKFGGGAGIGVFGLLLFGVGLWEFRNRKVNSADEVSQGLGLNVLGTLPTLPARLRRPVPGSARPRDLQIQNQMTESVDAIRTLLLHQTRAQALQVVMITSPGGGEGKTSLASQLAASLARAWRKTLLVDGDLRNPAAHKLFDVPLEPGLSEVLRGEIKVGEVVRPTPLSRLWMVPAGHWDSHAVQALAQDGVRALFAQLKSEYEFIIVDSCPVLPVADALLLGQHVDAVILSVLRDVSRLPAVHAAHQRFNSLGVRTLGAVVIGAPGDVPAMPYQYPQPNA